MNKDRPSLPAQVSELISLKREECAQKFVAQMRANWEYFAKHGRTSVDPNTKDEDK